MYWYHYFALISLVVCLGMLAFHLSRLARSGKSLDYALPSGDIDPAVRYSFTGAMNPAKKESAFLHLPTYTAGILYHIGTFICIGIFLLSIAMIPLPGILKYIVSGILVITTGCGAGILVKRMVKRELKNLSSPDDYISNILVTIFQLITVITIIQPSALPVFYVLSALLLLYIPFGKLRHMIYFFAARYHLGVFYGRRGVWPPRTI